MLQDDPLLEGVSGIVFDEFHERSLEADLGLALALDAQSVRDDLRLLVMSATLDVEALLGVLGEATPLLESQGEASRWRLVIVRSAFAPTPTPTLAPALATMPQASRR